MIKSKDKRFYESIEIKVSCGDKTPEAVRTFYDHRKVSIDQFIDYNTVFLHLDYDLKDVSIYYLACIKDRRNDKIIYKAAAFSAFEAHRLVISLLDFGDLSQLDSSLVKDYIK